MRLSNMAQYIITDTTLEDIADAIRAKTGKSASMTPLEMPTEIASISGGGETVTTLWTNSNPSSSFSAQTITLSDVATNYRKLRIEVYQGDGNYYIDYDMSNASKYLSTDIYRFGIMAVSSGTSNTYARYGYFNGAYDKIHWSTGYRTNSTNTSANICKPAKIHGVN